MDRASLQELVLTPSAKVRRAIEAGNLALARRLCDSLPKEYVLLHKGLRIVVELLVPYNRQLFARKQTASSQHIISAIATGDNGEAVRLIAEVGQCQYSPLERALYRFLSDARDCLARLCGDDELHDLNQRIAGASVDCPSAKPAGSQRPEETDGCVRVALEELITTVLAGRTDAAVALLHRYARQLAAAIYRLSGTVQTFVGYGEQVFRREQAALANQIAVAVDKGDGRTALDLIDLKLRQHLEIRDVAITFLADTFDWVYRAYGDDALYDCQYYCAQGQRKGFEDWNALSPEDFLRATTFLACLQAYGRYTVEEDEEKYTILNHPCGSGGKLLWDGHYDGPNPRYSRVRRPQPMTFGLADFPIYCTHCAVWNNIAPIEWFGYPIWVQSPGLRPGDRCVIRIYKNKRHIPADYYRSLGKRKPEP